MITINKDTKLYGSFSNNPGNNGCLFFNKKFEEDCINAIYKSFYSDSIENTILAVKHLRFSGFALSSPHKIEVVKFLNYLDIHSEQMQSVNTVVNKEGNLYGFNTDWIAIYQYFKNKNINHINIIGTGGFAKAIVYALTKLNISFSLVFRKDIHNIDDIKNEYFINATPIEIVSNKNTILDMRPNTELGREIALIQAEEQYKIYKEWMV